jgi:hypothetical protein
MHDFDLNDACSLCMQSDGPVHVQVGDSTVDLNLLIHVNFHRIVPAVYRDIASNVTGTRTATRRKKFILGSGYMLYMHDFDLNDACSLCMQSDGPVHVQVG